LISHTKPTLTTQFFVKGESSNTSVGVYRSAGNAKALALVTSDFAPMKGSKIGEVTAHFDVVLGATPQENENGRFGGGPPPGPPPPPRRFW